MPSAGTLGSCQERLALLRLDSQRSGHVLHQLCISPFCSISGRVFEDAEIRSDALTEVFS